jgi:hypothetical protein
VEPRGIEGSADLIDRLNDLVLGERMAPPDDLPEGAVPEGVVLRSGRLVPWLGGVLSRLGGPAAAVTLGRTIVINPGVTLTPGLLAHELAHVRQWRQDPLFPIRYSLATLRHGYHNNPYEVEAREFASAPTERRSTGNEA